MEDLEVVREGGGNRAPELSLGHRPRPIVHEDDPAGRGLDDDDGSRHLAHDLLQAHRPQVRTARRHSRVPRRGHEP